MWYRYETHMHSREGSACGKDSAADMVRAYHAAGYAGAVLTDHFIWGTGLYLFPLRNYIPVPPEQ